MKLSNESILALGWDKRHSNYAQGTHLMVPIFDYGGSGLCLVLIEDTDGAVSNLWENSETVFYGLIKTAEDLKNIMRFTGIIEY